MKLRSCMVGALGVLLLSSCAKDRFEAGNTAVPKTELKNYATYEWSPKRTLNLMSREKNNPVVDQRIVTAVDRELGLKGLTRVGTGQGDLVASYAATSRQGMESQKVDEYFEYANDDGPGTYPGTSGGALAVQEFEEGTLVFDLSERKTGKLVYRGSAKATLLDDPSPTRSDIRLRQIVSQLLSGVPRR